MSNNLSINVGKSDDVASTNASWQNKSFIEENITW